MTPRSVIDPGTDLRGNDSCVQQYQIGGVHIGWGRGKNELDSDPVSLVCGDRSGTGR